MDNTTTWLFEAADSWFFGTGKPMNAGESAWIESQFPPTGITLQGAIRTAVLYHTGADIDAFINGRPCLFDETSLNAEIGDQQTQGNLYLTGPFLTLKDQLLFPAPLDLIKNKQGAFNLLTPSENPVQCDLGDVRLPMTEQKGCKTQEGNYLASTNMQELLSGQTEKLQSSIVIPLFTDNPSETALADREPKIGLARNNLTRTNIQGMLFAISPIRPRPDVRLAIQVTGITAEHTPDQVVLQKLGGESKLALIKTGHSFIGPEACLAPVGERIRFKLVLTQPALMPVDYWLPDGFSKVRKGNTHIWRGVLNQCPVEIISACTGKSNRIGGWDLFTHSSKPHKSYIPAGSVYFCEAPARCLNAIKELHNGKLGKNTENGFGHVLVGQW